MRLSRVGCVVAFWFGLSVLVGAQPKPFRLSFADTDLNTVVRAISLRTGADVVYGGPLDVKVSLNVTANDAEEALRLVTAAAKGVLFKKVGDTYVVAGRDMMRQAIEPFGNRLRVRVNVLTPAEASKLVEEAFPFVTARPFGDQVLLVGAADDLKQAQEFMAQQDDLGLARVARRDLIPLRAAFGKQVADMLANMFPGLKADFIGDEKKPGGAIGLTGSAEQIEAAKQMIATVDARNPFPEYGVQYQVYEIRYGTAPRIKEFLTDALPGLEVIVAPDAHSPKKMTFNPLTGVNLGGDQRGGGGQSGASTSTPGMGGAGDTARDAILSAERTRYVVLKGTKELIQEALGLLAQVDSRPNQVVVEVKVVDTSPERAEELGLKWNWTRFGAYETAPGTGVDTGDSNGPGGDFTKFITKPMGFGALSRVPWSFESVIGAMVQNKEAKLLANPSLQVIDNEEANIFIGDTIRARTSTAGGLGTTSTEIVEFPVGIILLLRPRVNADGDITMRVHPVVSTVSAIDSQFVPQTSTREAETTVMVKNGETVVIGGLIRDEMSKIVREVPFLSKLPLVGELFKSRSTSSRRSEVLIFITPRILQDGKPDAVPTGHQNLPTQQPPSKSGG
ncbi:MAG: hypothetical protein KIS66_14230 [Fimbriimonadaceae bacterium]|nr:hypothetical protein [Fimbriimonadaceae bacterium]